LVTGKAARACRLTARNGSGSSQDTLRRPTVSLARWRQSWFRAVSPSPQVLSRSRRDHELLYLDLEFPQQAAMRDNVGRIYSHGETVDPPLRFPQVFAC
jgi:hypothetical protein